MKNTYNTSSFVNLLNMTDLIDVILLLCKWLQDKNNTSILETLILYAVVFLLVSEWLLLNANSAFVQLYHGENKLNFNEIKMRC